MLLCMHFDQPDGLQGGFSTQGSKFKSLSEQKDQEFCTTAAIYEKRRVQRHCCQKKGPADSVRVHCQLDWMRLMQN